MLNKKLLEITLILTAAQNLKYLKVSLLCSFLNQLSLSKRQAYILIELKCIQHEI